MTSSRARTMGLTIVFLSLLLSPLRGTLAREESPSIPTAQHSSLNAKIKVHDTSYNLGNIKPMNKTTAVFTFQNAGDSDLKITNVQKCCGAQIRLAKNEYRPGESGFLMATYQVGQGPAAFHKVISLFTNDPGRPQVTLTATGKIVQTLSWTPTRLDLPLHKESKTAICPDVHITSLDGSQFSIKGFTSTNNCLTAAFDPNAKATEFILKPQLDQAKAAALVSHTGTVQIALNHPDYPEISLRFSVIPPIQTIPAQIIAFNVEPGRSFVRTLKIQDNEPGPNQSTSLDVASVNAQNGTKAKIKNQHKIQNGDEVTLEILPATKEPANRFITDQLAIQLKDGSKLTVPLRLFYKSALK